MNTDSVEITKVDDQMAKLVENNKIKFKDVTKARLSKLDQLSGLSKRVETKILEKEHETMSEKITQPDYYPTEEEIRRVAALEIYLEFLKDGIFPTDESIDQKVELVAFRAIKVKEEMKEGMDINKRAILAKLNGIVPLEKEEQEIIEGLIDEEAAKEEKEEVVEDSVPPVEEVPEEPKEELEEKIEDKYIDLDLSEEENLKTGLTEEEVQSVQEEEEEPAVEYADIDASEEETPVEEEEEKEESVEEEPVTEEKDASDEEIEELLKESDDIKQRISEVADKRKAKEEEKAKAQKANEEAVHEKEMRDKALKEAVAKYREKLNKEREKLETETKSLEEEEKGIQELDEQTKAIKDQTKKMNKTIELLLGKLEGSEKSEEKSKKK